MLCLMKQIEWLTSGLSQKFRRSLSFFQFQIWSRTVVCEECECMCMALSEGPNHTHTAPFHRGCRGSWQDETQHYEHTASLSANSDVYGNNASSSGEAGAFVFAPSSCGLHRFNRLRNVVYCLFCLLTIPIPSSMVTPAGKPTERVSQIVYMVSEADKRYDARNVFGWPLIL